MTLGVRNRSRYDDWIAPGTAFVFSLLTAFLAPRYPQWFGANLPELTVRFLAGYPLWIAITVLALIVEACIKVLQPSRSSLVVWKWVDDLLGIASVLIIIVGVIALALPALRGPSSI